MADELLTTSFGTDITDITGSGAARTMEIYDKKVKVDISEKITEVDPDKTPFVRFLEMLGNKRPTKNYKFEWMDKDNKILKTEIAAGAGIIGDAADTGLVVDDADLFQAGDVLKILDVSAGTSEIVTVASKTNATTYVIVRAEAGTTGLATFAEDDEVIRMGSAFAENTGAADPDSVEPNWYYNLCQTFKASVDISGRFDNHEVRGENSEIQYQLESRMKDFNEGVETAFLFGNRHYKSGTNGLTFTGGLEWFIDTYAAPNAIDASAETFSQSWMNSQSNRWFRYGSKKKMMLTSGDVITKISDMQLPYIRENKASSDVLGIEVMDVKTPHGTLSLVHSRTMDESDVWNKQAFIIDPQYVAKRYMQGRDVTINMNIQNNDVDGKKHEILADIGLEVRNPQAHFVISGLDTDITT
jgi:hypothetical protein